jgi:hypothetical protein
MHFAEQLCVWGCFCCDTMRPGYILLHRQGLTQDEWKHPIRTLAWIDFCTMAAYDNFTAEDGVVFKRGEVVASYGFLATRWHVSKDTAYQWIKHWIAERQVERRAERCAERSAERFFLVNYAKYQDSGERVTERHDERSTERNAEQMKVSKGKEVIENKTIAVRIETTVLYDSIDELCAHHGVKNHINLRSLDILVDRYVGKVRMKVEVQHCMAWLVENGHGAINATRLGNWFKKCLEIQKRDENRQHERREKMNQDPALYSSKKSS